MSSVESDESLPRAGNQRSPLMALAHRWPLAVVAAIVGVGLGLVGSSQVDTTYTAEARVAVGYGDLTSGAIAGFPTAATDLASNYARYINDRSITEAGVPGASVTASPIPSSNVIRIEGVSTNADLAKTAVSDTASNLIDLVNNPQGIDSPESLLGRFTEVAGQWAAAVNDQDKAKRALDRALQRNATPEARLTSLRAGLTSATTTTETLDLQKTSLQSTYLQAVNASQSADLILVVDATITGDDASSRHQRYGLLGLVLGVAIALVVAVGLERRKGRANGRPGQRRATSEASTDS